MLEIANHVNGPLMHIHKWLVVNLSFWHHISEVMMNEDTVQLTYERTKRCWRTPKVVRIKGESRFMNQYQMKHWSKNKNIFWQKRHLTHNCVLLLQYVLSLKMCIYFMIVCHNLATINIKSLPISFHVSMLHLCLLPLQITLLLQKLAKLCCVFKTIRFLWFIFPQCKQFIRMFLECSSNLLRMDIFYLLL